MSQENASVTPDGFEFPNLLVFEKDVCSGCYGLHPVTHRVMSAYGWMPLCNLCADAHAEFLASGFPRQGIAFRESDVVFTTKHEAHGLPQEKDTRVFKEAMEHMHDFLRLAQGCTVGGDHSVELWITMRLPEVMATVTTRLV